MRRRLLLPVAACTLALAGCGSGSGPAAPTSSAGAATTASGTATTTAPSTASSSAPGTPTTSAAPTSSPATSSRPVTSSAPSTRPQAPTPPPRTSAPAATTGVGGSVVVLNPGHNGGNASHAAEIDRTVPAGFGEYKACDTTGTNTNAGYPEHAFTFDVALRARVLLQAAGVRVVLTRTDDTSVGPCVDERAAIGNRADVAAVVSIHADGAAASGHGFHVNQDSRRPDGASAAAAAASVRLGRALHGTLAASSGLTPSTYIGTDGYYYRSDLAGLNLARRPATFLELGNMRNAGDAALLSSAAGRQRIAGAVATGILAYLRAR